MGCEVAVDEPEFVQLGGKRHISVVFALQGFAGRRAYWAALIRLDAAVPRGRVLIGLFPRPPRRAPPGLSQLNPCSLGPTRERGGKELCFFLLRKGHVIL